MNLQHDIALAVDNGAATGKDSGFTIVGIGASAGGLESLEKLFAVMPQNSGMAFVVVQHLSPDFKSLMDELLGRRTNIPIQQADDGVPLRPNTIFLIPPKKEAIVSGGRIHLTDREPKETLTLPIDHFFRSLAQEAGERAVAVVLSGSGSDGSRGIRDVRQCGGLVICESEATAKFDGMPLSAQESGVVDLVLQPEEIAGALMQHCTLRRVSPPASSPSLEEPIDDNVETIFRLLNQQYGIDFSHYKPTTVSRRIQRRLSIVQCDDIARYAQRLQNDAEELNSLYHDLLIGVTSFFRDVGLFEQMQNLLIPELLKRTRPEEEIRAWVAGCATGEEAYSIGMLLHEKLEQEGRAVNVKIFATDVHKASLDFASNGVYPEEALKDVSEGRRQRYFEPTKDGFRVDPELRKMIVFAPHNVLKDAPFTKLDLIACRNLLIYFQPAAQKKALSLFHFGLKTGGGLVLGPSETPGDLLDEFEVLDEHWKIFRKRRDVRFPIDVRLPVSHAMVSAADERRSVSSPTPRSLPNAALVGAYDWMLDRFMPPSILIDDHNRLLHVSGGVERFLRFKRGRPTGDALELFDDDLRNAIVSAVQRVQRHGEGVCFDGLRVVSDEGEEMLRVTVEPVQNKRSASRNFFISIEPCQAPVAAAETRKMTTVDERRMSRDRIENLEGELRFAKENLQSSIESLETTNEELQATNEELVASNEELQSTNEELHSVNEELYTVNAEYQKKIGELTEITADLNSLMESTDVATVFLDRELRIRKFTPQIGRVFNLLPQDVGRCIDGFAHHFELPGLNDKLQKVLKTGSPLQDEVRDRLGRWMLLRMLPYRPRKDVEGVVLTLIDVNSLKQAQLSLAGAVKQREAFLAMLSHELRNPIAAILSAVELVKNVRAEKTVALGAAAVIERQGRHVARLLDDLLDISRISQDKLQVRKTHVDLRDVVQAAVETVANSIKQRGQTLNVHLPPAPATVLGDADRLCQVCVNLLTNAMKYSPRGSEIALALTVDEGSVKLVVRDNGDGIAPEILDQIFEPFFQAPDARDRSDGGMGVGLSVVRSIVQQHEGAITAHSPGLGLGSEFVIVFPFVDAATSALSLPVRQASGGCRKVVIVEDQPDNREMLASLLRLEGLEVITAGDGETGIQTILREQPELALVDIDLPRFNGYQVAREVRGRLDGSVYLVAVTGHGQMHDIEAAREAGFDEHLLKPIDFGRLTGILRSTPSHAQQSPAPMDGGGEGCQP